MALLNIRQLGDPILSKKCKPVREITPRIEQLVSDMFETMYDAEGVGLAAPQVGVLKRIVVIDTTPYPNEEEDPENAEPVEKEIFTMINPEILSTEGTQKGYEGCLSYAGMTGVVTRPEKVKVRYTDLSGDEYELEAEGFLARCICHELDHLEGIMYTEKAEGKVMKNEELAELLEAEREKEKES